MPDELRTSRAPALIVGGIVILACVAAVLGYRAGRAPAAPLPSGSPAATGTEAAPITTAADFIHAIAGSWQSGTEQLLIQNDKGVVEILRQVKQDDGKIRLDQYVGAPVRLEPALRRLELETPDGLWLLKLIPGEQRPQLSITYPDKRHVLYE